MPPLIHRYESSDEDSDSGTASTDEVSDDDDSINSMPPLIPLYDSSDEGSDDDDDSLTDMVVHVDYNHDNPSFYTTSARL